MDSVVQLKGWMKQHASSCSADDVSKIVRSAQRGTRVLQTACMEAKEKKMGSVSKLVPATKRTLEQFVQYVKVLLNESERIGKFWVGNLKHKNLQGEILPVTVESQSEQREDEEEEDDS
jgi:fanconi anemia group D2 protein